MSPTLYLNSNNFKHKQFNLLYMFCDIETTELTNRMNYNTIGTITPLKVVLDSEVHLRSTQTKEVRVNSSITKELKIVLLII